MALTPQEVAQLKVAGFTPAQIKKINSGSTSMSDFALVNSAKKVLAQGTPAAKLAETPTDMSPGGWGALGKAVTHPFDPKSWADFYGMGTSGQQQKNAGPAPGSDVFGGRRSVAPPNYNTNPNIAGLPSRGSYGTNMSYLDYAKATAPTQIDYTKLIGGDKGSGEFVKGNENRFNSFGGPFGTNIGSAKNPFPEGYVPFTPGGKGEQAAETTPPIDQGPAIPTPDPITIPVITPHDFTPQATKIADSVFAPLFDQLTKSKTNIGEQGKQNQQVLSGLYSGMVNDIAKSAAESAAQAQAQKAEVGQRGQALQQEIGGGYQSANQDVTNVAKTLGLEAAAPGAVQQSAADEAWQKAMAGQNTNAMQNYVGEEAQSEANLDKSRQDVARTTGAVAQENNLKDVSQALAGVDAQTAGYQAEKGRTAIDIAQNLSSQDLSAQGTNAGLSMQGQGMNQDAIWKAFEAAQHQTDTKNSAAQNAAQVALQNKEFEWKKQMDQANLDLDTAKAAGASKAGAPIDPGNYVGPAKGVVSLANVYGDKGRSLGNLAQQVFTTSDAASTGDMNKFTSDLFAAGHAAGYSDIELRDAAQTMFPLLYQKPGP